MLVKLHQIQNKLEELENSCKINQEIQCQIDPLQKAKLQAKVIKTQAALNLLEVSGVDAMTLKNQFVANLEVKKVILFDLCTFIYCSLNQRKLEWKPIGFLNKM